MREEIQNLLEFEVVYSQSYLDGIIKIAEKFAIEFWQFIQRCWLDSSGKYLGKITEELLENYK